MSILTSLDDGSLRQIGFNKKVRKLAEHQARLAKGKADDSSM